MHGRRHNMSMLFQSLSFESKTIVCTLLSLLQGFLNCSSAAILSIPVVFTGVPTVSCTCLMKGSTVVQPCNGSHVTLYWTLLVY